MSWQALAQSELLEKEPTENRSIVSTIFTLSLDTRDYFMSRNAKGLAQAEEDIEGWGLLVSLKQADIGPVHTRSCSELFLREGGLFAQLL